MSRQRRTLAELRQDEDAALSRLLRASRKLEEIRAARKRAEKREGKESVLARYFETNALAVPCGTCDVDVGAHCLSSGEKVPPHRGRIVAAGLAKANQPVAP